MWGEIASHLHMVFSFTTLYVFLSIKIDGFMFDLNGKIPTYLTTKRNIVRLIFFTAAFALIFINIYAPFGVETWLNISRWELLGLSSLVILTGVLVVVISRVIMYHLSHQNGLAFWKYFTFILFEIVSMALFYALFEKLVLDDKRYFPDLLKTIIQNTALVLLIPYSIMWLYFSWLEKKEQLAQFTKLRSPVDYTKIMIPFHDTKGDLCLSVKFDDLLYIEAADNYVIIYYSQKSKVSKYLIRTTLKNIETENTQSEIVRCHRSFMVNFNKVNVLRKDNDGKLQLELEADTPILLPVSKTYMDIVLKTFSQLCPPG